jgi:hypothetical protein
MRCLLDLSKLIKIGFRIALPAAIFAMISFYLVRDIPWDDEAGYHLDGIIMMSGKVGDGFSWGLDGTLDAGEKALNTLSAFIVFSPLYSVFSGIFDSLFGIEMGVRVTWIVGGLCLIAAFAMVLQELGIPKNHQIVALSILSASSIITSWVGVSRAGITFVLLSAFVALRFPRRFWSSFVVLVLVILGALCRLEVILAAPLLILLWGRKSPSQQSENSSQINNIYRWSIFLISVLLAIGTLKYTSVMRSKREWLAFQQHYTVMNQYRLSADSNPWRDMSLLATDFPGAKSVGDAWNVNPKLVIEHYLKTGLQTSWTGISAVAPRLRLWFLSWGVIFGMIIALWLDGTSVRDLALQTWTIVSKAPSSYILIALILASASSFLIVAEPRHVVGLTVATILFCVLLAQHPGRLTNTLMIASVGFWVVSTLGLAVLEMRKPQPNATFINVAAKAAEQADKPLVVNSYDSNITCMYLGEQCSGFSSLRAVDPCVYFGNSGDLIVTLRDHRQQLEQCAQGWQRASDLYNYDLWLRTKNSMEP